MSYIEQPTTFDPAQGPALQIDLARRYAGGHAALDISAHLAAAQYAILFAMRGLRLVPQADARHWHHRAWMDQALLRLGRAKWLTGRAIGMMVGVAATTHADEDVAAGLAEAARAGEIAAYVRASLQGEAPPEPELAPIATEPNGTEIRWADGVPIVPSICPIIVLQGSSYEMGRQYARQAIEIFGPFVLREYARRRFGPVQYEHLRRWEAELLAHAPEIPEMCRGWAAGATESGVPMRYENALLLWTSDEAPATEASGAMDSATGLFAAAYAGLAARESAAARDAVVADSTDLCSGVCAWGSATRDGRLVAAASTDHDCWFQATVMAYPDTGNAFVFTPFSANGWLPGLGHMTMSGLPGVNAKGLVLVHHGGDPKMVESPAAWGWGIRKGAAIFHALRFADSAADAERMEAGWPVGDVGRNQGAPGSMWADAHGAYQAESRERTDALPEGIVRRHTRDRAGREHDFLYVTNNALDPRARRSNGGGEQGLDWNPEGGWHTLDPKVIGKGATVQDCFARWGSKHSEARNRFMNAHLLRVDGDIDLDCLDRLYRSPGEYPSPDEWEARMATYKAGGQLDASPAHRGNAFVSLIDPNDADGPSYTGCIGPTTPEIPPRDNSHGFYYFDETYAAWRLVLRPDAAQAVAAALQEAQTLREEAASVRAALPAAHAATGVADTWLDEAARELMRARTVAVDSIEPLTKQAMAHGQALRAATRAQVRLRQVINLGGEDR